VVRIPPSPPNKSKFINNLQSSNEEPYLSGSSEAIRALTRHKNRRNLATQDPVPPTWSASIEVRLKGLQLIDQRSPDAAGLSPWELSA